MATSLAHSRDTVTLCGMKEAMSRAHLSSSVTPEVQNSAPEFAYCQRHPHRTAGREHRDQPSPSHLTDGGAEAQRGNANFPASTTSEWLSRDGPRSPGSQLSALPLQLVAGARGKVLIPRNSRQMDRQASLGWAALMPCVNYSRQDMPT